jgi:ABC-2 type transport system permease protein
VDADTTRTGGIFRAMAREFRRMTSTWYYLVLFVVLPLVAFALIPTIFAAGVPRDLPVAVVDSDHSALSRQATRMIDATPSMRVAIQCDSFEAARAAVLGNQAYAIIEIPADLERDMRRGEAPKIVAYYNAQYLLPSSLIRRDLRAAIGTLSAGLEAKTRVARGESTRSAMMHIEPIRIDSHTLFNPQLNYVYYLAAALLPALMQIFIMVGTVHVLGIELKEGTAGDWMKAARDSSWRAVVGKLLPYTVYFVALGLFMLGTLFRTMGVPMRGNFDVIVAATVLFVLAYQAVALMTVAWTANLRFATSTAALYSAPAFAFVGITFPTMGMPVAGRVWGEILPLTHYLRVLVEQAIRGSAPSYCLASLGALLTFVVVGCLTSIWRMGVVAREPRYWGRV